jgi:hypothetical protein
MIPLARDSNTSVISVAHAEVRVCLIADPGPDPSTALALLLLGSLHSKGSVELAAVVANGSERPAERAALARCLLKHAGAPGVPVGVGSAGAKHAVAPYEFALPGLDVAAPAPDALPSGKRLLLETLRASRPRALTFICLSSLRDLADVVVEAPQLVLEKTFEVVLQGNVERTSARFGWQPERGAANNAADVDAAALVHAFCFEHGVALTVVARDAVPLLPMRVTSIIADRTACPVLRYVADAQRASLAALWQRLHAGELPARCDMQVRGAAGAGVGGRGMRARARAPQLPSDAPFSAAPRASPLSPRALAPRALSPPLGARSGFSSRFAA